MLELIYNDLAVRNKDKLLTYENFLLFFGLTGLWGAKLFRQFDEDGRKLISKEEFFYGLCMHFNIQPGQRRPPTSIKSNCYSIFSRTTTTMASS
jgi:hypothetical protein